MYCTMSAARTTIIVCLAVHTWLAHHRDSKVDRHWCLILCVPVTAPHQASFNHIAEHLPTAHHAHKHVLGTYIYVSAEDCQVTNGVVTSKPKSHQCNLCQLVHKHKRSTHVSMGRHDDACWRSGSQWLMTLQADSHQIRGSTQLRRHLWVELNSFTLILTQSSHTGVPFCTHDITIWSTVHFSSPQAISKIKKSIHAGSPQ